MKLPYDGKALYIGPDYPLDGLMHGTHYHIVAKEMKSGRVRVDIDAFDFNLKLAHMTYDKKTYDSYFAYVKDKKGNRKK